jgi:hypothetical protein
MSKAYYGTLISKAMGHIKNVNPMFSRVENRFMVEKSLDLIIKELQESQQLLQLAKESYITNHQNHPQISPK